MTLAAASLGSLARGLAVAFLAAGAASCGTGPIVARNAGAFFSSPAPAPSKVRLPYRGDARLAVVWIGHATTLVQLDDKFVLTDPVFVPTVGSISRRVVEPGMDAADLPVLDAVLVSHLHFDHFSLGSLDLIEKKTRMLLLPGDGLAYLPRYSFDAEGLHPWESWERDGLRVTAVPVRHSGWRYGIDDAWFHDGFTGYVIQYHGLTVYFGGDTAYDGKDFVEAARRFPSIDLAILPISPIRPRAFLADKHMGPGEALDAFRDLKAKRMVPVHFGTFINGLEALDEPPRLLRQEAAARHLDAQAVQILGIGEQRVLVRR